MSSILSNVLESIKKYPSKVAIIHHDTPYTYHDLDLYSSQIANYLSKNQVAHDSKVIFLMRRSFDMLATLLAIWKRGATYIPLDLKTPAMRIEQIIHDIHPTCIVCDPALLHKISHRKEIPLLTLRDPAFMDCDTDYTLQESAKIAYMIYTSGSTGKPKGVMISHPNLVNHIVWLRDDFGFSSADCFSFNSSMAFDFSVACTLLPLAVGATIVISTETDALDIATYCQTLEKYKVTFAKWTPSYFRLLTEYAEGYCPNLSSFRYIMVAGEEFLTNYAEKWFNLYPFHSLINEYGPTETTVGISTYTFTQTTLNKKWPTVPIGKPAVNSIFYVIDSKNNLVKEGEMGELLIGGASVGLGYYQQPHLNKARFIDNPFDNRPEKLYRTGDLVKKLQSGNYLYMGRMDNQVKVNGFRIELSEIEHHILQSNAISHAKITVEKEESSTSQIHAYLVLKENAFIQMDDLRKFLSERLPNFMIPDQFFFVREIPVNKNGKVDYDTLKSLTRKKSTPKKEWVVPPTAKEYVIAFVKAHTASIQPDFNTSFFSLGMSSLLLTQLVSELNQHYYLELRITDLFSYPTIEAFTQYISNEAYSKNKKDFTNNVAIKNSMLEPIAIIAMDCRLPGANDCEALWELCKKGSESIEFFSSQGNDPAHLSSEKNVYARGILKDLEYFDAHFFGFTAKDAHLSDPQHRLLMESAWIAFEKSGYIPELDHYKVGIYVSMNDSTYVLNHHLIERLAPFFSDRFALQRLMSPQCLATKIAYSLNCTGPSMTIQTACSGSLVAVALACQQLSSYQCDIALAGGISLTTPQERPYVYQRGNIFSPTGHCHPFDAKAEGTVFSNGLGTIVLKRLKDALNDNDSIISVIKGVSTNNDGHDKMSFTAPSVQGQLACILAAQQSAGIEANSIQYIEAHGTGTLIGDPIEIEALSKAFRKTSNDQQFCAIGSLKGNIGHTHVAAGIAGLIKTALALQHCQIPPSINIEILNPHIHWENSPFYVNQRLLSWANNNTPRRAGVSAFGVGGTNAHVIVEEAPTTLPTSSTKRSSLLLLSAKSKKALKRMHDNLIQFLKENSINDAQNHFLADVAYTLQVGRKEFDYKTGVVCHSIHEAIKTLEENGHRDFFHHIEQFKDNKRIVFLFPGQGTEYVNLSRTLYEKEMVYQQHLNACLEMASMHMDCDLKSLLFPVTELEIQYSEKKIHQTEFVHPLLFSVEYALAQLLLFWGIKPDYLLGHSLGEYVAACLSGVFSLEAAIEIVCTRGKAIAQCNKGAMLSVPLPEKEARLYCNEEIYLAAINADELCVLSGSESAIERLHQQLVKDKEGIAPLLRKLNGSYPFHSKLLTSATAPFLATLHTIKRQKPMIPYFSNLTGNFVCEADVMKDSYWVQHMLNPVQFLSCVKQLATYPDTIYIEVGPGHTLSSLMGRQTTHFIKILPLLQSNQQQKSHSSNQLIENALKTLWCHHYPIHWKNYYQYEKRRRIPLPTYPFEKQRYWFDEIIKKTENEKMTSSSSSTPRFYVPTWIRQSNPLTDKITLPLRKEKLIWIIFSDHSEICSQTRRDLESKQHPVYLVEQGLSYIQMNAHQFSIEKKRLDHYEKLIQEIVKNDVNHYAIIHFWSMNQTKNLSHDHLDFYNPLYSGLLLTKAFYKRKKDARISCVMVTNQLQTVMGNENTIPMVSSVLSLCRVLSLENSHHRFSSVDVEHPLTPHLTTIYSKNMIYTALTYLDKNVPEEPSIAAYRHHYSWHLAYEPVGFSQGVEIDATIKPNGVYLITGGLGAMGLTVAEWILSKAQVTLLLLSRRFFPAEKEWDTWLERAGTQDETSQIIQKLKNILAKGSRVKVLSGDISNFQQMAAMLKKASSMEGEIKGIFHLAGVPGQGLACLKDIANMESVLSPKVQGMLVLSRLFKEKPLDFLVCASSLTSIVGGVGQLDYCAANLFLDYFMSDKQFTNCKQFLTMNWNAWSSIGMAAHLEKSKTHETLYSENSVSPEEAMDLLEHAFRVNQKQLIISRFHPEAERKRIISAFAHVQKKERLVTVQTTQSSMEEKVKQIWQDVLGLSHIDPHETFYASGGDSLSAIQLLAKLDKQFNVDIALQEFVHAPTLASLTNLIKTKPIRTLSPIVPLSNESAWVNPEPVVYFIHPLGGTVFCYLALVPYLTRKRTYYAIQDPELAKGEALFHSITDMAESYVEEIKKHQNKNKEIILAGASFGGNIAIEMTLPLKAASYTVKKIILIDSWANLSKMLPIDEENKTDALKSLKIIRDYYGIESQQYHFIKKRLLWLRSYTPSSITEDVVLLTAKDLLPFYKGHSKKDNGWAFFCTKPIIRYEINGNHDTMFETNHLSELGKLLSSLL